MRRLAALAALLCAIPATAQELRIPKVRYPALPARGATAAGFVPTGWRIDRRAEGDLDGDGRADLALVLRDTDRRNVIANSGFGERRFDTNPRLLMILLAVRDGRGYRLALTNHSLIARRDNPSQMDPFAPGESKMRIVRRTLKIQLQRFMSAGGADAGPTSFTFRWQGDTLRLIGFEMSNVQRMTGETSSVSIDYLTRRMRLGSGRIEDDADRVRWKTLPPRPLLTIDAVGDALEFDPEHAVSGGH
jgi:hypothetical protein